MYICVCVCVCVLEICGVITDTTVLNANEQSMNI